MHINLLIFILFVRMTHHWQQTGLPTYTDIIATATSNTDSLDSKIPTYELLTQFPETLTLTFNSMYQGFQLLLSTWHHQLIPSKQSHLYVDYEALTRTTELHFFQFYWLTFLETWNLRKKISRNAGKTLLHCNTRSTAWLEGHGLYPKSMNSWHACLWMGFCCPKAH